MANYPLEKEFFAYVYYLNAVQGLDQMPEVNLIKIVKDDNDLSSETKAGLLKALGSFLEPTKEAAKEKLADIFRSPQARSRAVIIDTVVKLKEANISINEIPYEIRNSIFNGIEFGNQAEEIQNKWKKLLEASIAGRPVRKDYARLMDTLEPVEARLLDKIYITITQDESTVLSIEELADTLGIKGYEEEALLSIDVLSNKDFHLIECHSLNEETNDYHEDNIYTLSKNLDEIKSKYSLKGLFIEDKEGMIATEGIKRTIDRYKVLSLSTFGTAFMKIVSGE